MAQYSKKTIQEAFDPQWLTLRYAYDAEARNPIIEAKCLAHFSTFKQLQLVDVGAGTGSNCLYLLQKFPQHQDWYLIDHNPALLQAAKQQFLQRITTHHFKLLEEDANYLVWQEGDKQIRVKFIAGILQNISILVPLKYIDLVCANAVFDLFTPVEFEAFAHSILDYQIPFYTTINYHQMSFSPDDETTKLYLDYYERHMQRQLPQGQPMGKTVSKKLEQLFYSIGYQVDLGKSNWQLTPKSELMMQYLLGFMESSIPELLSTAEQTVFYKWIAVKKEQIKRKTLSGIVEHFDILAIKY